MSAHFPLDGGKGHVVTDVISGHTGTLINADPAVSFIPSDLGGALHLDGNDDRVIVPHHRGFDFGDESFSISFWVRWPQGLPPGHQRFLTKGDYDKAFPGETGKRYEFFLGSGDLRFVIDDDVTSSRIQVSAAPFLTGEWVHLAAVRDRKAKRLKLYANGVLLPTTAPGNPGADGSDNTGNISNPRALYIGDSTREDAPFQGDLDDLRFFRHALSDQQVAAIAAKAKLVEVAVVEAPAKAATAPAKAAALPPMTAHFPLREGKGTMVADVVSGAKGTLENADPAAAWTSSAKGLALRLDGKDDRVVVPNNPAFDFAAESFSVSFHVRWTKQGAPRHEHLLTKGDYVSTMPGETGKRWEIDMTTRGMGFIIDDDVNKSQIQVPATALLSGEWVHVVAVRDTKAKLLKLYFNEELQASTDATSILYNGVDQTGSISNPRELVIGDSSRRDNPLNGELSDIRIYRGALDAAQVSAVASLRVSAAANPVKPPVQR